MKQRKRICSIILCTVMLASLVFPLPQTVAAQEEGVQSRAFLVSHGTKRDEIILDSMVKNDPPKDYVIPEGLVQDAKDRKYEEYFPKESIQTVSIKIREDNLNYMLQNAAEKPSVMADDITIGDTTVGYVGMKTKGNFSLQKTNETESDRFSFTINFGKYIKKKQYGKKQNFYGCDKISFNNLVFDKTAMKEYNAMRLMDEMGVPTPQYSIAKLYINGKYYGLYFMVEAMETSIIERSLNASSKEVSDFLTKPENGWLQYNFEDGLEKCLNADGEFTLDSLSGYFGKNDSGDYIIKNLENGEDNPLWHYGALWEWDDDTLQDVAEMLPTALTWNRKVQLLSQGKNFAGEDIDVNGAEYLELLDSVMDIDRTVRYFATHSFIVQMDNMFTWRHNFGLYIDKAGKGMLLPWDYDFSWGCDWNFNPNNAQDLANWNVDMLYPDNWSDFFGSYQGASQIYGQVPFSYAVFQNSALMDKYHMYMEDCAKIVSLGGTTSDGRKFEPGRFGKTIDIYYPQIQEAAKTDDMPWNAFYLEAWEHGVTSLEQPKGVREGIPELKKAIAMRAVGVWLQLHGKAANVTGYGCDLYKLGNAKTGTPSVSGNLTVVNADTGIFATADYESDSSGPFLSVTTLASADSIYKKVAETLKRDVLVYQMKNEKEAVSDYQLYLPVSPESTEVKIYSYAKETGKLTELEALVQDNLYCVTVPDISYIVVASGKEKTETDPDTGKEPEGNTGSQASLSLSKSKVVLYTGKAASSVTIEAKVVGGSSQVSWKSSDAKVATVKNGKITAIGKGAATVTASANGIKKTVEVTVKNPVVTVKSSGKSIGKIKVKRKKSIKLSVTTKPAKSGVSLKALSKKNKKIASAKLKNGKLTITGKKKGKVVLSLMSGKAVKKITVNVI